jgi:hypothetical protein
MAIYLTFDPRIRNSVAAQRIAVDPLLSSENDLIMKKCKASEIQTTEIEDVRNVRVDKTLVLMSTPCELG